MGNMCFRDWEDGIKNTIYYESLHKGVTKKMSTKDWKNGENVVLKWKRCLYFNKIKVRD